jgi:Ca2+-binding EF-hand superfamily protein
MRTTVLLFFAAIPDAGLAQTADRAAIIARMGEADTNRDGMVTKGELTTWRAANFMRFDRNADGAISDADIPSFARGTAIGSQFNVLKALFDNNRDRKVTRDEFVNGPTLLFDLADADHDNILTRNEMDATAKGSAQ